MRRALARPAVRFLLLGALLVGVDRLVIRDEQRAESERPVIEIDPARRRLRAYWLARTGASPDAVALRALVEAEDRRRDPAPRSPGARLRGPRPGRARAARAQRRLLRGEDERRVRAGDARSVDEALALGLANADLVVRRRLIERMRADLASRAIAKPTADDVEARFAREAGRLAGARASASRTRSSRATAAAPSSSPMRGGSAPRSPRKA